MTGSGLRAAAISSVIAGALLYGGAGTFGAASAAADGDPVSSSTEHGDDGAGSASKDTRGERDGSVVQPGRPGATGDPAAGFGRSHRGLGSAEKPSDDRPDGESGAGEDGSGPDGSGADGTGQEDPGSAGEHSWPWPWPSCKLDRCGLGGPRPRGKLTSEPPQAGGGGAGGSRPNSGIPPFSLNPPGPPEPPGQPGEPGVARAETGTVQSGPQYEPPPIDMPPVISLPPAVQPPVRVPAVARPGPAAETPSQPRGAPRGEPAAVRESPPPAAVGNAPAPGSARTGYPEYLRNAKIGDVAALALPGVAGIIALTALGGVVGYRQAKAGHLVRAAGPARFLQ